jgi:GcrA cell cycle regulator
MAAHKRPVELVDRVAAMSRAGMSTGQIAEAVGMCVRTVQKIRQDAETGGTAPPPQPSWWTTERLDKLSELVIQGLTAGQICNALGAASRSAVCGKIFRLGLRSSEGPSKPRLPGRKVAKAARERVPRAPRPVVTKGTDYAAPILHVVPDTAKPWLERQFGECAFPVCGEGADTFSCCAPTEGTYCPGHYSLTHVRSEPRKASTEPSLIRRRA